MIRTLGSTDQTKKMFYDFSLWLPAVITWKMFSQSVGCRSLQTLLQDGQGCRKFDGRFDDLKK